MNLSKNWKNRVKKTEEYVILVDNQDKSCGRMEKLQAHQEGLLHRAVSIWIVNPFGKILLQKRALDKYHSAGLWSNACCSHPREGESTYSAASRRLQEELGITCPLTFHSAFIYQASVGKTLIEHEFDHLFWGLYDGPCIPNPEEASEICWVDNASLQHTLDTCPSLYTSWLPKIYAQTPTMPFKMLL